MKPAPILLLILLLLASCDPMGGKDLYQTGTIVIKAQVINPRTTINLGDSVAFYFEVPDTVELNGAKLKVTATQNDGGNVGLTPYKIVASHVGGSINDPFLRTCKLYASLGSLSNNETLSFSNQNGKLMAKLFLIPQEKGVYYLLQTQQGYVDLNNQDLKLRFSFNFGSINRNHQLLIDSAGAANNFNLYLQDKINQGLEVYGFKVN